MEKMLRYVSGTFLVCAMAFSLSSILPQLPAVFSIPIQYDTNEDFSSFVEEQEISAAQESVERLFSSFANPLSDALAGCSAPEQTTAAKFQAALGSKNPGVYLDFLGGVPLADLSAWLSGGRAPNQALTDTARRLLLTVTDEGDVVLYYINEDTGLYYACETTRDLAERLSQLVEGISPNGAAFAFESGGP